MQLLGTRPSAGETVAVKRDARLPYQLAISESASNPSRADIAVSRTSAITVAIFSLDRLVQEIQRVAGHGNLPHNFEVQASWRPRAVQDVELPLRKRQLNQRDASMAGPRPGCLADAGSFGGIMSVPFVLGPGEQHAGAPTVRRPFIRIGSDQTDGLIAVAEAELPPRTAGPNLHVHANEDEMFLVLNGVMTVQIGEQIHDLSPGGIAWGARRTPHAYANRATEPLRIMILWIPGGVERLFEEMAEYITTAGEHADEQITSAILSRYGATRVGPQIPVF
jgi:mannose-6-phosphate isomerase-like protein (cupin superfamily)